MFFFEKKNQKTFGLWRAAPGEHPRQKAKVFCFFSSEKKAFLSSFTAAVHSDQTETDSSGNAAVFEKSLPRAAHT
jgi:hypothetical protein